MQTKIKCILLHICATLGTCARHSVYMLCVYVCYVVHDVSPHNVICSMWEWLVRTVPGSKCDLWLEVTSRTSRWGSVTRCTKFRPRELWTIINSQPCHQVCVHDHQVRQLNRHFTTRRRAVRTAKHQPEEDCRIRALRRYIQVAVS